MEQVKLDHSYLKMLAEGKKASYCISVRPDTCTVLGYDVTSESDYWKGLQWKYAMIDGSSNLLSSADYQYLHVDFIDPVDSCDGDNLRYRVRPILRPKDIVLVEDFGEAEITSVQVAGMWDEQWWWRITIQQIQVAK